MRLYAGLYTVYHLVVYLLFLSAKLTDTVDEFRIVAALLILKYMRVAHRKISRGSWLKRRFLLSRHWFY